MKHIWQRSIKMFNHRVMIGDGQFYPTLQNSKFQNFKNVLPNSNGVPIMYTMYWTKL
jgi:hypothetical protein